MASLSRKEKLNNLVMNAYRELYANCTTPVDFDFLVEKAEIGDDGKKIIPYNKFFITKEKHDEIVEKHMKSMKLSKLEKDAFKFEMCLGCGPTWI